MIQHRIAQYIQREHLFGQGDNLLVALSGGADSVALLRLLHAQGYMCQAAHCNFHLRGEESDKDEEFVRNLCQQLNVPLHIAHFDTTQYATDNKISIEMAARQLRYTWFAQVQETSGAVAIAVGHHKDDSVETLLLNLIRGTGINGLRGIQPKNGYIVRPLLCATRQEIIDYLQHINQSYVTDSSNAEDEYTRNKIRLYLLPLMQQINPSVKESIIDTSNYLTQAALLYNKGVNDGKQRVLTKEGIHINSLLNEPSPQALLFEIVHPLGFNSAQIESIFSSLQKQAGKQFVSKDCRIIKDREWLLIDKLGDKENENTPPFRLEREEIEYTPDFIIPREKSVACFDAEMLNGTLTLRKWQAGDTFSPLGMQGSKLVSDYLTDRKFSLAQKEQQWVLCCDAQIVWVVGERTDNRYRITQNTQRIIKMIRVD